jgi:holliday junction DNA helicase RuvA
VIASVQGPVAAVGPHGAVVEVGGVGLSVQCTPATLARLRVGQPARLSTSLVVREDSLTLYGFSDDDERSVFELLQTASGVGPRLAQAVLSVLPPSDVRRALATGDGPALTRVPGIGKKGAERMILELRDKIGAYDAVPAETTATAPWKDQVASALVGLGWSQREADEAVAIVAVDAAPDAEVPALLRTALRVLSPR